MGKNKLSKFAEMESFSNVLEVPFSAIKNENHPMRGKWNSDFFKNENPIVLELGCGKGEYVLGLSEMDSQTNYVGVDIKGARMWKGAKYAHENKLNNAGFLRTHIELIDRFFAPSEISEIWLTFPDPQMKKTRKRLTSARFIELYLKLLKPNGIVHLKTDSNFQYQYTLAMAQDNHFKILNRLEDVHGGEHDIPVLSIKTYYEKQWIARGLNIKYLSFIPVSQKLIEPDVDIEPDTYRSFGRGAVSV